MFCLSVSDRFTQKPPVYGNNHVLKYSGGVSRESILPKMGEMGMPCVFLLSESKAVALPGIDGNNPADMPADRHGVIKRFARTRAGLI